MPFTLVVKGMPVELTSEVKDCLRHSAAALRNFDRRLFMARTVCLSAPTASVEPNGNSVESRHHSQGHARTQQRHPLLRPLRRRGQTRRGPPPRPAARHPPLVDPQSQINPPFDSRRLYSLTAAEVRRQLIARKGYADAQLPSEEAIRQKMHDLGYRLNGRQVQAQKDPADRRHLRAAARGEPPGRCVGGHAAAVAGRQGQRENRPVFSGRADVGRGEGAGPRLQG